MISCPGIRDPDSLCSYVLTFKAYVKAAMKQGKEKIANTQAPKTIETIATNKIHLNISFPY